MAAEHGGVDDNRGPHLEAEFSTKSKELDQDEEIDVVEHVKVEFVKIRSDFQSINSNAVRRHGQEVRTKGRVGSAATLFRRFFVFSFHASSRF